jgi:hypothetical protein
MKTIITISWEESDKIDSFLETICDSVMDYLSVETKNPSIEIERVE